MNSRELAENFSADFSFERQLLKHPHYAGHISQWNNTGGYQKLQSLATMTRTKVQNTIVTCTVCRGEKDIAQKHWNGHITWEVCPNCHGSGKMYNGDIDRK